MKVKTSWTASVFYKIQRKATPFRFSLNFFISVKSERGAWSPPFGFAQDRLRIPRSGIPFKNIIMLSERGAGTIPHFKELCITKYLTKQILNIFYGQLLKQTRIGCDNVGDQLPFAVLQL